MHGLHVLTKFFFFFCLIKSTTTLILPFSFVMNFSNGSLAWPPCFSHSCFFFFGLFILALTNLSNLFSFHYSLLSLIRHQQYCKTPSQMLKFSFHICSRVKKGNSRLPKEKHNFGKGKTTGSEGKRVIWVSSLIFYPIFSPIRSDAFLWDWMENTGAHHFLSSVFSTQPIKDR